ncbi:SNF2 family N-terminal domain-containing protein [Lipomyces kononenkoae]
MDPVTPPPKRRRFFKDEDAFINGVTTDLKANGQALSEDKAPNIPSSEDFRSPDRSSTRDTPSSSPPHLSDVEKLVHERKNEPELLTETHSNTSEGLDETLLESITGRKLEPEALAVLRDISNGDMTRAVNFVFDGTLEKHLHPKPKSNVKTQTSVSTNLMPMVTVAHVEEPNSAEPVPTFKPSPIWKERYLGSFQVEGWATRSGRNLLQFGDEIKLKRVARQVNGNGTKRIGSTIKAKENDIFVRFTNMKGDEIGRLPADKARFVSTLLDLKICIFTGTVIYVDPVLRTGDSVILQLKCFLSRSAFNGDSGRMNSENSLQYSSFVYKGKETSDERHLRLRQMALIKLFMDIGLEPHSTNDLLRQHSAKGQLEAAAMAEQFDIKVTSTDSSEESEGPESDEMVEEDKNLEQDQLDSLYRKAQTYDADMPEVEPSGTFNMELRPYQKQGLGWMISKETFEKKGDEKQIDSMHPLWEEYRFPVPDGEASADEPNDRFYSNPYSGELSLEFPKIQQSCLGGILADEMGLGKTISTMSLVHSSPCDYSSGLERTSTERKCFASSTTLVVAPMSLLTQWESEAKAASKPGTIEVLVYYGDERAIDLDALCLGPDGGRKPKVIITSYGTVASEWQKYVKNGTSKLFRLHFLRVVLDEAHTIRNRASITSRACCALRSDRKWALTGTPIVNRLEDLYSLVKYLGVEPWSHFPFWRTFITAPYESKDFLKALDVVQTVLEPIILRRTKSMKQKDGSPLIVLPPKDVHIEHILLTDTEREVYDLFYRRAKQTFAASVAAGTVLKSYTTIFAQILRLRQCCDHPALVQSAVRKDEFELEDNGDEKNKASLLQREDDVNLQQLIDKFNSAEEEQSAKDCYGYEVMQQILKETERECLICSTEPITDQVVTPCWHMSCRDCLLAHIKYQRDHGQKPRCHSCRAEISEKNIFEVVHHYSVNSDKPEIALRRYKPQSSAKISRLLSQLKTIRQEEPNTKSVVFSQFTSFLDLIQDALQRERYKCIRIDGSTVQRERARVLEQFQREKGEVILLLSLKTGGVGLNLVSANKVFMMDPWWSFAVESQAIDRIHRMGQTQSVSVFRFIVQGSVEERMLKIQDRKKFLASSLGMMSEDQKKMQRIEEIKLLFD